ncbi:MAG: hypothetical protein MSA42_06360 [Mollicutes bacterium]|nr:hypothetical protein [Mollicutes bacterium]MDD7613173.1 hypothetical protein [Mollicutes bacterium]MDY5851739.1 hypothetical protein [Candidatus Enterosoma sp.]
MKDYRKTKARFFLGLFFFLSLTGLGITWIIYSALTKEVEVGKYESSFPALIARIIRLSSSAVLGIAYLTYLIVTYFKKPKLKIRKETKAPFIRYDVLEDGASLTYKDYFIGTWREEKKNRNSLLISSFYLLIACVAVAVNPRRRKTSAFFFILLVLVVILIVFLTIYAFLLPYILYKKAKPARIKETIEIDSTRLIITNKDKTVCYDFDYMDNAKETKNSFLFVFASSDGLLLTVKKQGRKQEAKDFLSDKVKEIRKRRLPY